ncbi:heparinase II/III domain-containing protein [Psychrobacter celer]|uniref:heparinase II/III domain-containing protein n=1 Tax=Psychrobacter celer TaxID=306572 RepID=UPI003FD198AE
MPKLNQLETFIDLAIVEAIYDGFQIKVSIITGSDDIETACYLYDGKEIVSRIGYKENNRYLFYAKGHENDNLRVKVFFRYKQDPVIKKSKFYKVLSNNSFKYGFSNNISERISYSNCEIIDTKPNAIEIYEKKGFKPRNDNIPYILTLPISWLEDPFSDRNWMFQLHAWRMLDAYFKRGTYEDLGYIAQVINDWVLFEKNNKNKWLWYDMSTGLRALKITLYLKLCYEQKIDHNIEDINYLLHEHFRHLSNPLELNSGNHGLFQLHGLKSLAHIVESYGNNTYNISDMKSYANEKMSELIVSQLGLYGVHTEDSPDYHFFTHKKITNILNSPWWSDLDKDILKTLELGHYAKSWLVSPDDRCVTIGDSTNGLRKGLPDLENWPHIKVGKYVSARVDGYAVVRSHSSVKLDESSFLFFQGSFYSQAHKHCDDLSFILQEKGINLLIDSGKYGYQQDKYRKYFLSTRAHNTIEVDGKSTSRNSKNSYGSAILGQPVYIDGFWLIKAKVNHEVNQYIHERLIVYKPGKDLYVLDKLTNTSQVMSREICQWWHFDTNTDLTISDDKVVAQLPKNAKIEITSSSSNYDVHYTKYKGYESDDKLIGWVSKKYLEYEPTPTLSISSTLNKTMVILTRFKLDIKLSDESDLLLTGSEVRTKHNKIANYLRGCIEFKSAAAR